MMNAIKTIAGGVLSYAPVPVQTFLKQEVEIAFWRRELRRSDGRFYNGHYMVNYTELFGLDKSYYDGKRLLDIGCGPLGSLNWADNARERIGVDPLADRYKALNRHLDGMEFVRAASENLPFADGHFDVVSIFNALDHVADVNRSVAEACRVLAPDGDLLLIVEIDHPATLTEPHNLTENVLDAFEGFEAVSSAIYALREDHNIYQSLRDALQREREGVPAILCARLVRQPAATGQETFALV